MIDPYFPSTHAWNENCEDFGANLINARMIMFAKLSKTSKCETSFFTGGGGIYHKLLVFQKKE